MKKTIDVFGLSHLFSAKKVKDFLESVTGSGTVYALKVTQLNNGSSYATVQFTSEEHARQIIRRAKEGRDIVGLHFDATEVAEDIVNNPRDSLTMISDLKVYFGCLTLPDAFVYLQWAVNVCVSFVTEKRKMHFCLSWGQKSYRLELPYESIRKVHLHSPQGNQYYVLQLSSAPKIFEREHENIHYLLGNQDYYRFWYDVQWVRSVDFTSSSSIGQSSDFCLQLPVQLIGPHFIETFAHYEKHEPCAFVLRPPSDDVIIYRASNLVPVYGPPPPIQLPFDILFKVNALFQNARIPWLNLNQNFYELLLTTDNRNRAILDHALEKLFNLNDCCYEPRIWLESEYENWTRTLPPSPYIDLPEGLIYMKQVLITPCRVYFTGPQIEVSNSVLRHFSNHTQNFIRVRFVDEELVRLRPKDLTRRSSTHQRSKTMLYYRVRSILRDGIVIGDKKFEFLAFSSSQLRNTSVWMFAARDEVTASSIRAWMGNFQGIRNVAKYSARLGQGLSSSIETVTVSIEEIEEIADIENKKTRRKRYVFSDGIGKLSPQVAKEVAVKCGLDYVPSAFQMRYAGYKGVVAVDPEAEKKLSLRPSMKKFESENTTLNILAWSKYIPCYLNRQIITLLSTLGVEDSVFQKKQRDMVEQVNNVFTEHSEAHKALGLMVPGEITNILKEMLLCGYKPDIEPFLFMMLQRFKASRLMELRTLSRIFIPRGRCMIGCLDETKILKYNQVFVQYSDPTELGGSVNIFEGVVVVAKNPCLHPGDIRKLWAVNVPSLGHMVDCLVFPQKGHRPHPDECSGSDLDGDIYFVSWDADLIPPKKVKPMDYNPGPAQTLNHDVTIEEVKDYFTDFIVKDTLGTIANAHTVFADTEQLKASSAPCIELASKFSVAVDFAKTGIAAELPEHFYVRSYPDFMEKDDKPRYVSKNVLGKLYREVQEASSKTFTLDVACEYYDKDMEVVGFEEYLGKALSHKDTYNFKLGTLMDFYGINTEAEILSGDYKRRDADAIERSVHLLRKEALDWFNDAEEEERFDELAKASAWYRVTYHPSYMDAGLNHKHFFSFAWTVYNILVRIKKEKNRQRESL